ncbi:hypothetical protein BWK63_12025 [Flavobacterium covae]|uniref:hypothetical protein n=1 Tax=Flavobacterium TaxID=237 RepID=UPI000B4CCE18|nr:MULTISPECIES: hypothetical protein [Flavobacterium]OWP80262.1 hypothetical protein BWK63_12025 [Flavobacterium covae]OWP87514.1 hypothetical protein BWK60_03330 [Flavobacterium covae]POR20920.1 hypothetical protein BWK57_12000 [Flavobacterium columnare]
MKNISLFRVVLFAMLVGIMGACKSSLAPTVTSQTNDTIIKVQTLRDTIIKTKQDSSFYKALLECQNGKVVINRPISVTPGEILKIPGVELQDNYLTVKCKVASQEVCVQLKEKHTQRIKTVLKIKTQYVPRELTWWQTTQINMGRVFIGLVLLILIITFLRLLKIV